MPVATTGTSRQPMSGAIASRLNRATGISSLRTSPSARWSPAPATGASKPANLTIAGARPDATLHSDDGPLRVAGTFGPNGSYELSTDEGLVNLRVPQSSDLAIEASTSDGRIDVDGSSLARDDSAPHTIRLGAGSGTMKLATSDGSIHIYTNGDFLQ